jgi:hypothetical protein
MFLSVLRAFVVFYTKGARVFLIWEDFRYLFLPRRHRGHKVFHRGFSSLSLCPLCLCGFLCERCKGFFNLGGFSLFVFFTTESQRTQRYSHRGFSSLSLCPSCLCGFLCERCKGFFNLGGFSLFIFTTELVPTLREAQRPQSFSQRIFFTFSVSFVPLRFFMRKVQGFF